MAKYCSVECQTKHYADHKESCLASVPYLTQLDISENSQKEKSIERRIMIPDNEYLNMISELSKGNKFYLVDKRNSKTEVIKRIDEKYYEKESGNVIISMKEFDKTLKENGKEDKDIVYLTNWGKLSIEYIKPETTNGVHCVFVDRKNKKFILFNKSTDTIISEKSVPNLTNTVKFRIEHENDTVYVVGYEN